MRKCLKYALEMVKEVTEISLITGIQKIGENNFNFSNLFFCYSVQWPTNAHNYFTNYHTATCFETIVSSSDSL